MPRPRDPSTTTAGPGGRSSGAPDERVALVLDAGGARSAYQVGVLEVLLPALAAQGRRPTIQLGTSAGALLTAGLVGTAHLDVDEQVARLVTMLERATKAHVMRPLWRQAPSVAARYVSETLGLSVFRLRGLFGTGPLARTLESAVDWAALHDNLASGLVEVAAVTASSVRTGQVVLFTEAPSLPGALPGVADGRHRRFVAARLGVEHLMASSAIPALFPSARVREPAEAAGWYADGATRRRRPIAPALSLGADRVVVVGTGSLRPMEADPDQDREPVDLADGAATLLGAVMDDPLRHDLRRLADVNAMAADAALASELDRHRAAVGRAPLRTVPYVAIAPDRGADLADLALEVFRANHRSVRRTVSDPDLNLIHRMMGSDSPLQGEMLSYLMFDPDFFDGARDLGRRHARQWVATDPGLWRTGHLDPPAGS